MRNILDYNQIIITNQLKIQIIWFTVFMEADRSYSLVKDFPLLNVSDNSELNVTYWIKPAIIASDSNNNPGQHRRHKNGLSSHELLKKSFRKEEHISLIGEPGGQYLGHISLPVGPGEGTAVKLTKASECEFDEVLPPWYMAGVITPIFSTVWIFMLLLYVRICREASKHVKLLRSSFSGSNDNWSDWKSVQMVLLIMGCFSVCWLPYFVVACAQILPLCTHRNLIVQNTCYSLVIHPPIHMF